MDDSTTSASSNTGVEASTQPEQSVDTQAADTTDVSAEAETDSQQAESNQVTDDNLKWLQENKGLDPNSSEALAQVAKMYREAEKLIGSRNEQANLQQELQQTQDSQSTQYDDDPVAQLQQTVQALQMESSVNNFWNANPDAKQYEDKMTELVQTNPSLKILVNNGYLGLDNLYQMAKGADSTREQTLKTDGGREALQRVADKQQAKAVVGNASSSNMAASGPTKDTVNDWYAGLSSAERAKPETQATVARLLS